MNQSFGFINQVLLGGASIPWLTDPTLAKVSVLIVNLWLGFPYMFLVCTGALQSIPEELTEAATVDGARPWAIFRLIKLPAAAGDGHAAAHRLVRVQLQQLHRRSTRSPTAVRATRTRRSPSATPTS